MVLLSLTAVPLPFSRPVVDLGPWGGCAGAAELHATIQHREHTLRLRHTAEAVTRNRRYQAMVAMIDGTWHLPQYTHFFTEESMEQRAPELYFDYIGRFRVTAADAARKAPQVGFTVEEDSDEEDADVGVAGGAGGRSPGIGLPPSVRLGGSAAVVAPVSASAPVDSRTRGRASGVPAPASTSHEVDDASRPAMPPVRTLHYATTDVFVLLSISSG